MQRDLVAKSKKNKTKRKLELSCLPAKRRFRKKEKEKKHENVLNRKITFKKHLQLRRRNALRSIRRDNPVRHDDKIRIGPFSFC